LCRSGIFKLQADRYGYRMLVYRRRKLLTLWTSHDELILVIYVMRGEGSL
jgi:hypothetical protein